MRLITALYRRLQDVQRNQSFRYTAAIVALLICGGFFGYVISVSYSLDLQREALLVALVNQNANRNDQHAYTLKTTGTVTLNGRTYGGPEYLSPRVPLFDAEGNLVQVIPLVSSFISDITPQWMPRWLVIAPDQAWLAGVIITLWVLLIIWMELLLGAALACIGTAIPVLLFWRMNQPQLMLAFGGIGVLTFTFLLLSKVVLAILNQPKQIPAVAHTVVKESSRRGIALVFIVLLLVILPLLPLLLDSGQPLRFRIQSFMSWSMGLTFSIAAVMTLFFSCASVAFEIRDRQIWQLMTKPLMRVNYLLGKWLGVLSLNAVVLTVAGLSTYTFVEFLRQSPVDTTTEAGQLDIVAVNDEVLTARLSASPIFPPLEGDDLRRRVNKEIEEDVELAQLETIPTARRVAIERKILSTYTAGLRSIPWGGYREYTFTGLKEARTLAPTINVRYKFYILRDDEHTTFEAGFIFGGDSNKRWKSTFVPSITHSFPIPSSWIQEDGTLTMTIFNLTPQVAGQGGPINWEEGNLEVLYTAGTFEGNFIRALLSVWIKLAFLAALGICCATFLNFPVACLLSFTVFIAGVLGPYLAESLEWFYPMDTHEVDWGNVGMVIQWAFDSLTRQIALVIVFLLSSFGEYKPTQSLVEGRLIGWTEVLTGFLKLAVLWSGIAMIFGYLVLRRRQLAIYSGHG